MRNRLFRKILILSIVALSFVGMGMSYAYWTDETKVTVGFDFAKMELAFSKKQSDDDYNIHLIQQGREYNSFSEEQISHALKAAYKQISDKGYAISLSIKDSIPIKAELMQEDTYLKLSFPFKSTEASTMNHIALTYAPDFSKPDGELVLKSEKIYVVHENNLYELTEQGKAKLSNYDTDIKFNMYKNISEYSVGNFVMDLYLSLTDGSKRQLSDPNQKLNFSKDELREKTDLTEYEEYLKKSVSSGIVVTYHSSEDISILIEQAGIQDNE